MLKKFRKKSIDDKFRLLEKRKLKMLSEQIPNVQEDPNEKKFSLFRDLENFLIENLLKNEK